MLQYELLQEIVQWLWGLYSHGPETFGAPPHLHTGSSLHWQFILLPPF